MFKLHWILAAFVPYCVLGVAWLYADELLKSVVVGKDQPLKNVTEIKSFTALFFQDITDKDDLDFLLTLDGNAMPKNFEKGLLPTLVLLKDGKPVASAHLHVERSEKTNEVILEWSATPTFDDESHCFILTYPNMGRHLLLKIPFSAAAVKIVTKDKKTHSATLVNVRELVERRHATNRKP